MFAEYGIGYAQHVEWDVQDPPGKPTAQDDKRKGWHSWFAKAGTGAPADGSAGQPASDSASQPANEPDSEADSEATKPLAIRLAKDAGSQPAKGTASQPARNASGRPTRSTGNQPARNTGSQPAKSTPAQPARNSATQSAKDTAARPTRNTSGRPAKDTAAGQPAKRTTGQPPKAPASQPGRQQLASTPIVSRPLINPRLAADPRLRIWIVRTIISVVIYIAVMLWLGWRFGLTAAAIYACADTIYRSRTMGIIPASVRVTAAQRSTRRRLKLLRPAGYVALNACEIPGDGSIIDHVVVGPGGIYALDSERLDKRLPARAIGGMLYHGPVSQADRMDHALFEARRAAALIGADLGHPVKVHAAMVIYGPNVPWVVMPIKGVDVFNGGNVGTYFRRQSKVAAGHRLDSTQIGLLLAAAARALPPIS